MGRFGSRGGAVAGLVAVVAALALEADAAGPVGAAQSASFRVTVSGTISSAVNTFPEAIGRCRPTSAVGLWRLLTFRSARPTLITAVGGPGASLRFGRSQVRRLVGEIHLAAPSQYEVLCADGRHATVRSDYFTGSTSWRGGAVRLRSGRRGRIVVGPLRGIPQDPGAACEQLSNAPLGLERAPAPLDVERLFDPRLTTFVVRGGKRRSAQPSPTCGVSEAVEWELRFRRVR